MTIRPARSRLGFVVAALGALAGCVQEPAGDPAVEVQPLDVRPHADGRHTGPWDKHQRDLDEESHDPAKAAAAAAAAAAPITYHGGAVMTAPLKTYLIWYGAWGTNTATTIIPDFLINLSGSPYFAINGTYKDGTGTSAATSFTLAATSSITSASPTTLWKGTSLSDATIQTIVTNAISTSGWPYDPNAVYFLLTSQEVNATSGFCTQYCGWHNYATLGGQSVKYAFVGNPARCPASCAAQTTSPNGNPGADGMASIIAHELEETVSDPQLNAWYDSAGAENADKCAWTFGTSYTVANGSKANMRLGARDYYIQQNWINGSTQGCGLAVAPTCTTDAQCGDGNACNGVERCVQGACVAGTAVSCNDGDACTTDSCDPATGACAHAALSCDDGNVCTADSCAPATGCVHTSNPASCDDGNACTTDACAPATGCTHAALDCTGGNACLVGACDPTLGCSTTPVADGTTCPSGTCEAGACVSACAALTGTVSQSTPVLFDLGVRSNVTIDGSLACPSGSTTDVDLYLESQRSTGQWRTVRSSLGATCAEHVSFALGGSAYNNTRMRWRVVLYKGPSTSFSLSSCPK